MPVVTEPDRPGRLARSTVPEFDALVYARAGLDKQHASRFPALNGRVIEQAQILTSQNLAVLVNRGVNLDPLTQAQAAWHATTAHLRKEANGHRLRHRKNAALAWRQTVFYLSLATPETTARFIETNQGNGRTLSRGQRAGLRTAHRPARSHPRKSPHHRTIPRLGSTPRRSTLRRNGPFATNNAPRSPATSPPNHPTAPDAGFPHPAETLRKHPGVSGDFKPWEGWSHVREHIEGNGPVPNPRPRGLGVVAPHRTTSR